jgi:hypothetical protein
MNRCDKCEHWAPPDESEMHGQCEMIVHDTEHYTDKGVKRRLHMCHWVKPEEIARQLIEIDSFRADNLAVVIDTEGREAFLRTRADFGCVLFEPTEDIS